MSHTNRNARIAALILLTLLTATSALSADDTQTAAPSPTAKGEVVSPEKGLKSRIFDVKHRDPTTLLPVIRPLGSGARGSLLTADGGFRTITARDFPENLASLEEAIRRLDAPEPARADAELTIHVLLASKEPESTTAPPEDLKDTLAALKKTLVYRYYTPITTFVRRVKDRAHNLGSSGVAELPPLDGKGPSSAMQLDCESRYLWIEQPASGPALIRIDGFKLNAHGLRGFSGRASVQTDLTVREGERVVVGTSALGERGLVVVVSARLVK